MKDIKEQNELETGIIGKLLFKYSVPSVITMILGSTYNLVDTAFLGQAYPDGTGVAVTTLALPVMMILLGFSLLAGQGGNALAAILLGEGKKKKAEQTLGNSILLLIIFEIIIFVISFLFMDTLLDIIGTPENLRDETKEFVQIQCWGFICLAIGMGISNFIRTAGQPKIALLTNVISVVVCVFLNYVFVMLLHKGVAGSAVATIMGQGCGSVAVILFFMFSKKSQFHLHMKSLQPDANLMRRILLMGLANFAMSLASTVICVIFNWVCRYYGDLSVVGAQGALASIGIAQKVAGFTFMPFIGVAMGAQPIIGYNYGAKNWERVRKALSLALITGVSIGVFFLIVGYLFPYQIVDVFGVNEELRELSVFSLKSYLIFMPLVGFHAVGGTYFQSSGQPIKSAILELTRQVIFLIPLYLILPQVLLILNVISDGLIAVIICPPISDFTSSVVTICFIAVEMRKLRKKINDRQIADKSSIAE